MKIGFIGLGIMGSRMAMHLLDAGHDLTIHNRSKAKADELIAKGAKWVDKPSDISIDNEVIISMLAHPEAVRSVAIGENGFLSTAKAGTVWMDCSTVNPSFSKEMALVAAANDINFLDAPVAGSKNQAAAAQLVFFVGGPADAFTTVEPLMASMGKKSVHVGDHGMGSSLKIVVNQQLATSMAAFSEGMALGKALGLTEETLLNVLIGGPVVPPYLAFKREKIENDAFEEVEFPLQWIEKDLQMAAQTAYETNIPMPVTGSAQELYRMAKRAGRAEWDFSAIYKYLQ